MIVLTNGAWVALVVHALFVALFVVLNAWVLALFNVGSLILYGVCLSLIRRARVGLALGLATAEVIVHAWLAVGFIGWESGFHYYLFVLAPIAFFNPNWRTDIKVLLVTLLCLFYLALDFFSHWIGVVIPVNPATLGVINSGNIVFSFGFFAYFAYFYSEAVTEAEQRLEVLATTDPLTGLYNRRRIMQIAEYEISRCKRSGRSFALILADVDHFKQLNDRYGHDCGDFVLKVVAEQLRTSLRDQDSVARWGGEEFLLILPETGIEGAERVADKVRSLIASREIEYQDQDIAITITLGIAQFQEGDDLATCLVRADMALIEGKNAGRNRVVIGQYSGADDVPE